jgi:hypothetical protein
MSANTLRQVLGNQQAAQAATHEAKALTAKAYNEANATIRTLETRERAQNPPPHPPTK